MVFPTSDMPLDRVRLQQRPLSCPFSCEFGDEDDLIRTKSLWRRGLAKLSRKWVLNQPLDPPARPLSQLVAAAATEKCIRRRPRANTVDTSTIETQDLTASQFAFHAGIKVRRSRYDKKDNDEMDINDDATDSDSNSDAQIDAHDAQHHHAAAMRAVIPNDKMMAPVSPNMAPSPPPPCLPPRANNNMLPFGRRAGHDDLSDASDTDQEEDEPLDEPWARPNLSPPRSSVLTTTSSSSSTSGMSQSQSHPQLHHHQPLGATNKPLDTRRPRSTGSSTSISNTMRHAHHLSIMDDRFWKPQHHHHHHQHHHHNDAHGGPAVAKPPSLYDHVSHYSLMDASETWHSLGSTRIIQRGRFKIILGDQDPASLHAATNVVEWHRKRSNPE
ncbi:hypothetical protein BC940DRAFT_290499 [Gongronella butleri]|nr:hypothetical protein BC940DRAFT_290499 [Gongronella butleri]